MVSKYLKDNPSVDIIQVKKMMPQFIADSIINSNSVRLKI